MKRNTIKFRILKYNIMIIVLLITLTAIIFNVAVRTYMEKDIMRQLGKIAERTEDTALQKGKDVFPKIDDFRMPPRPPEGQNANPQDNTEQQESLNKSTIFPNGSGLPANKTSVNNSVRGNPSQNADIGAYMVGNSNIEKNNLLYRYYFMLDRSIREPLSVLNANYILLDRDKNIVNPITEDYLKESDSTQDKIITEITKIKDLNKETYLNLHISGTEYISIIKPVSEKNNFGLGWIIIYSSLEKIKQLQLTINVILLIILVISAIIAVLISSHASKKISEPFSSLNEHIRYISERNFGNKIQMPVYDELCALVNNINIMSEKLEMHDKAQKTFLQNASHELRTPLMAIQSYAEGIKYDVVDSNTAADIIIDESKRLTDMVEELLYLSRLDSIEENYQFDNLDFCELVKTCIERMNGIATKNNKKIEAYIPDKKIVLKGDDEKLTRAITNVINNCIRYAANTVKVYLTTDPNDKIIKLLISDDGPGFDEKELAYIFERFYKGKKGVFGLGLAITKNVIDKHHGKITASNLENKGALFTIELPMKAGKN